MKKYYAKTYAPHLRPAGRFCVVAGSHPLRLVFSWQLLLVALLLLSGGARAQAQRPQLRLDLLPSSGNLSDQAYVYFQEGATTGYDTDFDANKLPNPSGLNLSSFVQSNQFLAIDGLPPDLLSIPLTVKLLLGVPQGGTYTLQVKQLDNFTSTNLYLNDALLNTQTQLALGTAYTFDLTEANTAGTDTTSTRFSLQFQPTGPLPVTLTSFTAAPNGLLGVRLDWRTASEQQSDYFAIERSLDGQRFTEIGRVAAAGTTAQNQVYKFVDALPAGELLYYRLRQVDLDGSYTFSPVRTVRAAGSSLSVEAFPTSLPPGQALQLRVQTPTAGPAVLLLTDAQGRSVLRQDVNLSAGFSTLALPSAAQWAPGLYLLRVQQGSQHQEQKVVRE